MYDETFAAFFGPRRRPRSPDWIQVTVSGAVESSVEVGLASRDELLREKSFASCSDEELEALAALMERSPVSPPRRRSRRYVAARSGAPDLRRTIRRSLRAGAEPVERRGAAVRCARAGSCSCSTSRARCPTTRAG